MHPRSIDLADHATLFSATNSLVYGMMLETKDNKTSALAIVWDKVRLTKEAEQNANG